MFRCMLVICLLMGGVTASGLNVRSINAIEVTRRTNLSWPRRFQEFVAKGLEISFWPMIPFIDFAAGLGLDQRLQAKHLIRQRNGIYASQAHRYQQHQDNMTAKFYHDRLIHYRIAGVSHIGMPSSHVQPNNDRQLHIGGENINIADVSGVLVWNHVNYGKRVAVALQDAQFVQAHGKVTIPDGTDRLYGEIGGAFSDDFHLIRVNQVRSHGGEVLALEHDCTYIAPRPAITSLDSKDGELRSLL